MTKKGAFIGSESAGFKGVPNHQVMIILYHNLAMLVMMMVIVMMMWAIKTPSETDVAA